MRPDRVKTVCPRTGRLRDGAAALMTRRAVLRAAAAATVGALIPAASGIESGTVHSLPQPWWMRSDEIHSRVVTARSTRVLRASVVERGVLAELLDTAILALTRAAGVRAAWRAVLGDSRRILLKFNAVGARVIGTNEALAGVLVERLESAGYSREYIEVVELPPPVIQTLGCRAAQSGWSGHVLLRGQPEPLAQSVAAADAVINIALLKTHQIAGLSAAMKNLAYGIIRRPALYHDAACSPYIPRVIADAKVSSRLKLNIINGLRIVARNGPDAREEDVVGCGSLLMGIDPLAVDHVAWSTLIAERYRLGVLDEVVVPYLVTSAQLGVGRWREADIDIIDVSPDG